MPFKVKDLMINILPTSDPKGAVVCKCSTCTICSWCSNCTFFTNYKYCDIFSRRENFAPRGGSPEALALLKVQLSEELARVEQQEAELQGTEPQTVEEVDQLEEKLKEALKELQARRKTLQQGGSKK